jgi:hypothetical protein
VARTGIPRPYKVHFQHYGGTLYRSSEQSLYRALMRGREIARVQRGGEGAPQAEVWVWAPDDDGQPALHTHYDAMHRPPDNDDDLLSLSFNG